MSDETENVNAGSETSGDQAADVTSQEAAPTETETATAETTSDASQDAGAQDAGDAAAPTDAGSETSGAPDAEQSRTGFADKGLHAGDECICPDGRKGTVHSFDAGLICIPNHDQG